MKKIILLLLSVGLLMSNIASAESNVTLLCVGEYSNYQDKQLGVQVDGILLSISKEQINVKGAPSFSSGVNGTDYAISTIAENYYGFKIADNLLIQGNINRYTGKLSLSWLKTAKHTDGLVALLTATCQEAKRKF